MRSIKWLCLCLLVPSLVWADGVLTPAAGPVPYLDCTIRTTICINDEFLGGTNANSTIGQQGWTISGGVTTNIASEANRIGLLRRTTSASSGTVGWLRLGNVATVFNPADAHEMTFASRLNTNDTNTSFRAGASNSVASDPPNDGIYFEKIYADTNIFCVTRASSVQTATRIDSGVAIGTGWHTLAYSRTAGGVSWTIDGAAVCGVLSANIPTVYLAPFTHIVNNTTADKTHDVDYFTMRITGISR